MKINYRSYMTITDQSKIPISIRLPAILRDRVQVLATAERRSITMQIETMLEESLQAREAFNKMKRGESDG